MCERAISAARKKRAKRLLKKAEVTNNTSLMVTAKRMLANADKQYVCNAA